MKPGRVDFYYKSTGEREIVQDRLRETVDKFEKELLDERFHRLELDQSIVDAVDLKPHNVASMEERVGKTVGGMLPYMFILFCFIGAMYPAIDLGAGEKERGTLETLLTAPVNRFHILLGKFGVVVVSGLLSATVSIVGLVHRDQAVARYPARVPRRHHQDSGLGYDPVAPEPAASAVASSSRACCCRCRSPRAPSRKRRA